MASDVTLSGICPTPNCGNEATWIGSVNEHTGTDYLVECDTCDWGDAWSRSPGWTLTAQVGRWMRRINEGKAAA